MGTSVTQTADESPFPDPGSVPDLQRFAVLECLLVVMLCVICQLIQHLIVFVSFLFEFGVKLFFQIRKNE